MNSNEKGFTLVELLVSLTIIAIASAAAGAAIFQVLRNTENNSDHMTAVRQVESAGHWITRDIQMASSSNVTATLSSPDFLILRWTTWNVTSGNPIYYTARYFFENQTNGTGTLKRYYAASNGVNMTTLIAQYIYFDPSDTANTSNTSLQNSLLNVKITALVDGMRESREYETAKRPSY